MDDARRHARGERGRRRLPTWVVFSLVLAVIAALAAVELYAVYAHRPPAAGSR